MARARSPNRDKAKEIYLNSNGSLKLKDIASDLGVKDSQIRKWKSQDKWDDELKGALPKSKSNVTNGKVTKKEQNKKEIKEEIVIDDIEIDNPELTDKQQLFCIYYAKYFNASKAAIKAGYSKSYSQVDVYRLLENPRIESEIKRIKASRFKGAFLEKEDLLQKWIDIAMADITDYLEFGQKEIERKNEDGSTRTDTVNYVDFKDSCEVDGTIISEVKQGRDGVSIKLQDKMKALEFLSKHIGLLDVVTKEKLKHEEEKVKMAKEKLELEKAKLISEEDSDREGLDDFLKATTMSEEEVKALFEGEENGEEKEE